jgi:hypothetical protein
MLIREFLDTGSEERDSWPTGFSLLDSLTGGFGRGQLWVITGAPTAGKTTLLLQFVHSLAANHGFATDLYCSTADDPDLTRARFLSLAVRRAPSVPELAVSLENLSEGQQAGLDALRSARLEISMGDGFRIPQWTDARERKRCLAIDDPEGKRPPPVLDPGARATLRKAADGEAIVLVTVPRSLCLESATIGDRLREEWPSIADVVLELIPGVSGKDVLRLWQNRRGPTRDIPVFSQVHYSKFVETA